MVRLEPFVGLRPARDALARSVDGATSSGQRLARRARHPRHVAWLEAGDGDPPVRVADWLVSGDLVADERPCLRWVEQLLPDGHVVAGVLGRVALDDLVLHEQVDPAAVRRRERRDRQQEVDPRPLLAVLADADVPSQALRTEALDGELEVDMVDDNGARHRVVPLSDDLARRVTAQLADRPALLADGHHRVAAARVAGRADLPTLVTLPGMGPHLLPVWRVVVSGATDPVIRAHLARDGDPNGVVTAHWQHQRTRWSANGALPVVAAWEQARRVPQRVRITTASDPAAVAVAQRDGAILVGAPPPTVADVLHHVASIGPLPPKSTAFHPKPRVGLVLAPTARSGLRHETA